MEKVMYVGMHRTGAFDAIKKFFSYGKVWLIMGMLACAFAKYMNPEVFCGKVNPLIGEPDAIGFSFSPAEIPACIGVVFCIVACVIAIRKHFPGTKPQ